MTIGLTQNLTQIASLAPLKLRHGGRKRLSLIQMVLLTHLKAGFGKRLAGHVIWCNYANLL